MVGVKNTLEAWRNKTTKDWSRSLVDLSVRERVWRANWISSCGNKTTNFQKENNIIIKVTWPPLIAIDTNNLLASF